MQSSINGDLYVTIRDLINEYHNTPYHQHDIFYVCGYLNLIRIILKRLSAKGGAIVIPRLMNGRLKVAFLKSEAEIIKINYDTEGLFTKELKKVCPNLKSLRVLNSRIPLL